MWVLIVMFWYDGWRVEMQEFNTLTKCEAAKAHVTNSGLTKLSNKSICIPK